MTKGQRFVRLGITIAPLVTIACSCLLSISLPLQAQHPVIARGTGFAEAIQAPQPAPVQPQGGGQQPAQAPATPATTPKSPDEILHFEVPSLPFTSLPPNAIKGINRQTGEILDLQDARALILAGFNNDTKLVDSEAFYCLLHIFRWKDVPTGAASGSQQTITVDSTTEHWYVYHSKSWHAADFSKNNRVFGIHQLRLMFVHLNPPAAQYTARYQASIANKLPANIQDVLGLAQLFITVGGGGTAPDYVWGTGSFSGIHSPSDVTVQGLQVNASTVGSTFAKMGSSQTFDNEGKYWWDVSIGVPITKVSQLSINTTDNTVTTTKIAQQTALALLDLFPKKVDFKTANFYRIPTILVGASLAKQPLHKIFVGIGFGPAVANVYVGALFVKQNELQTLMSGSVATPAQVAADTKLKYSPQFSFGLNITIVGATKLLTAPSSKTSSTSKN